MSNKDTGGPAFPFNKRPEQAFPSAFKSLDGKEQIHAWGMTLRNYFAAKAMQGLLADPGWRQDMDFEETAHAAYEQADAMLKAGEAYDI
jgi:hypothetical protein